MEHDKQKQIQRNKRMTWAIAAGAVFLSLWMFSQDMRRQAPSPPSDIPREKIKVAAQDLFAAYDANEAGAQQMYGDKRLEVSGEVTGVELDFNDEPVIKLAGENRYMGPRAELVDWQQGRAGRLKKGQPVEMTCESVSEVIGIPMLADCRITSGL